MHPTRLSFFTNFNQFYDYLLELGLFKMDLSLTRVQQALWELKIKPNFLPIVHVLGTNGKGSTAHFLASLAQANGLRTGLFTSPHLVSVKERIKINNKELEDSIWLEAANQILPLHHKLKFTYFEYLFLLACLIFKRHKVDLAIFEAGLGGTYDATNILEPILTIFTPISLDHTNVLGKTISQVAQDKAGAIKHNPVISASQPLAALDVLKSTCARQKTPFIYAPNLCQPNESNYSLTYLPWNLELKILPQIFYFQNQNLQTALVSFAYLLKYFDLSQDSKLMAQAINQTFIPARFQRVSQSPEIFLDVAHNPNGFKLLLSTMHKLNLEPEIIIFSCMQDKDYAQIVQILTQTKAQLFFCELKDYDRALTYTQLQQLPLAQKITLLGSVKNALEFSQNQKQRVLFCGSFYLLGELLNIKPEWLKKLKPKK